MTAAIYIIGIPDIGDKPEPKKTVKCDDEKVLISHLKKLQEGYCEEGDKRPKIRKTSLANGRLLIECYSESDFSHVALVGMRLKKELGMPIETLN